MAKKTTRRRDSEAERTRRLKNRKRHRMFFRVICCLLVCAAAILATTVFFRVSEIEVSGETRYDHAELIGSSGVVEGDNLFFLQKGNIIHALENTYPYLDTIKLKRHLPGTLEIAVTERTPLITAQLEDSSLFFLDKTGKVLEQVTELRAGSTIFVAGVDASELKEGQVVDDTVSEKIVAVLDMLARFEEYGMLDKIVSVDITKSFDVKVNYDDCYTLELGTLDNLEHKIQFLIAILKRDDLAPTGIIDLTSNTEARYRPAEVVTEIGPMPNDEQPIEEESEEETTEDSEEGERSAEDSESTDLEGEWQDGTSEDESTDDGDESYDDEAEAGME